jgi:hypothetical protein
MPIGPNSKSNIGIRRIAGALSPPQRRNFEPNGQQLYRVAATVAYSYGGSSFAPGSVIPFNAAAGTKYSHPAQLERDFNRLVLDPAD